jgi:hypothetical protein
MPRGNDSVAATAELQGQYGEHGNAEQLIQAARAMSDPLLASAQLKRIDAEKTEQIDVESIEPEFGGRVVDAAHRGDAITYVAIGEDGRSYKGAIPAGKLDSQMQAKRAERQRAAAEFRAQREVAQINAEIEQEVEEYRRQKFEEARSKIEEARDKAQQEGQAAAKQAAEEEGPEEEQASGAPPTATAAPAAGGPPRASGSGGRQSGGRQQSS